MTTEVVAFVFPKQFDYHLATALDGSRVGGGFYGERKRGHVFRLARASSRGAKRDR